MDFNFQFYGNISFGSGSRFALNEIVKSNNWTKSCFIIDNGIINLDIINNFLDFISIDKIIIECDISEPTYDKLEEKRLLITGKSIDVFIGIGGGSALDMAKGLSVLHSNLKPAIYYRGFDKFKEPISPIIAIPTTAGTGSEITPNASFIDSDEKRKMGINGEKIRPKYAILDPELTLSCPKNPTISAGVDSLVHATEAFVAKKTNRMAQIFAKKGFNLVIKNLPKLVNSLDSIKYREEVMFGAFLSAIALMNSGTGPAAAMSYPLGVHFGVPHGIGGGIFLPHVMEYNINCGYTNYINLYNPTNKEIKAHSFLENIFKIWKKLNIPDSINQYGVNSNNINGFINDTLDLKPALDQNPVKFGKDEINSILIKLTQS